MEAGFDRSQVIPSLKTLVEAYLRSEAYDFEYLEEYECFETRFEMDEGPYCCYADIFLYDDMLSFSAYPSYKVPAENRDKAAILLNLLNNLSDYTQLYLDNDKGDIICRSCQLIESVLPGQPEVEVLLGVVLDDLNRYDKALQTVAFTGADPHLVFAQEQKKIDEEG